MGPARSLPPLGLPDLSAEPAAEKEQLVPTEVRFCFGGCQRGVFATKPIAKGSLCWEFSKMAQLQDKMIPEAEAKSLLLGGTLTQGELMAYLASVYWQPPDQPRPAQGHGKGEGPLMIDLRSDDSRFFNHSGTHPSMGPGDRQQGQDPRNSYALRDIADGEELLENLDVYSSAEPLWFSALLLRHGFDPEFTDRDRSGNKLSC